MILIDSYKLHPNNPLVVIGCRDELYELTEGDRIEICMCDGTVKNCLHTDDKCTRVARFVHKCPPHECDTLYVCDTCHVECWSGLRDKIDYYHP